MGSELRSNPAHQQSAAALRAKLATHRCERGTRVHAGGHVVAFRALPDYDTCSASISTPASTSERLLMGCA